MFNHQAAVVRRVARSVSAALVVLCAAASLASAQSPDRTSDVYQDWVLNCATQPPAPAKPAEAEKKDDKKPAPAPAAKAVCEIVQTFRNRTNGQTVAVVALGKPDTSTERKIVIQVPVGVWLPDGMTLTVDGKNPVPAQYLRCSSALCVAQADARKELLDGLKSEKDVAFEFADGARTKAKLSISGKGFADALSALDKRSP